jgi:hypothetical protein
MLMAASRLARATRHGQLPLRLKRGYDVGHAHKLGNCVSCPGISKNEVWVGLATRAFRIAFYQNFSDAELSVYLPFFHPADFARLK